MQVTREDSADVVAIVAHLTNIVLRRTGTAEEQAARKDLAALFAATLCAEFDLDQQQVADAAKRYATSMRHPQ